MSRIRTFTIRFAIVAGVLLALGGALSLYAASDSFDRSLRERALAWGAARGMTIEVETLDFHPFGPSLTVTNLRVSGPEGRWAAGVDRFSARLHFLRSLFSSWTLSVDADRPSISGTIVPSAREAAAGGGPLPEWKPPDVSFRRLVVSSGEVDVSWEGGPRLIVGGFEAAWQEEGGKGSVGSGALIWRGGEERLLRAEFEGERRMGVVRLSRFLVETDRARAEGEASFSFAQAMDGHITLAIDGRDLPAGWLEGWRIARFAPVRGRAALDARLGGSWRSPRVSGRLEVFDGRFGPMSVDSAGAKLDLRVGAKELRFAELTASTSAGTARDFVGVLRWAGDLSLDAEGEVEGYDLRHSMELVMADRFPVGARASGHVAAKGPLYPDLALDCEAEIAVENLDVTTGPEERRREHYAVDRGRVAAKLTVGRTGIDFEDSRVESDSFSAKIPRGRLEYRTGLEFETDVSIRSLATVQRYLPDGFEASGKAEGEFGGPFRSLSFHYDLDLESVTLYHEPFGRAVARADYDLETLVLERLRVEGPQGIVEASGRARLLPGGSYDLDVTWVNGDLSRAAAFSAHLIPPAPMTLAGRVKASGKVGGELRYPVFEGEASVTSLDLGPWWLFKGIRAKEFRTAGSFGIAELRFDRIEADAYGARWTGRGTTDLKSFRAEMEAEGLELARLPEMVLSVPEGLSGLAHGSVVAEGRFDAPHARAVVRASNVVFEGEALGDIEGETDLDREKATIRLRSPDARMMAEGTARFDGPFQFDLLFDALPWARLPVLGGMKGISSKEVTGKGRVEGMLGGGPLVLSRAEGSGKASSVRMDGFDAGEILFSLAYPVESAEDGPGRIEVRLSGWEGAAKSVVLYPLKGKGSARATVELRNLPLEPFRRMIPVEGGAVDGKGVFLWPEPSPEKASDAEILLREIRVETLSGRVRGATVSGIGALPSFGFEGVSEGPQWLLKAESEAVTVDALRVDPRNWSWRLESTLSRFDFFPYVEALRGQGESGLSGKLSAAGKRAEIEEADGSGEFADARYDGFGPLKGRWRIKGSGGRWEVELTEPRSVTLSVKRHPDGRISGTLDAMNAPVSGWGEWSKKMEPIEGKVTGTARFGSAPAQGPADGKLIGEMTADVEISSLELVAPQVRVRNVQKMEIAYRDGEVRLRSVRLAGEGFDFAVEGSFVPGERWDVAVKGSGALEVLRRQVPILESASGTLKAQLAVKGPWANPRLEGQIELSDGAEVKVEELAYPLKDIRLRAAIRGETGIEVERFEARFGSGTLRAEGRWALEGVKPAEMKLFIEARDIHYEQPQGVVYDFDADALVTGRLTRPEVRGEVRLKRFTYRRQMRWRTSALELLRRKTPEIPQVAGREEGIYVDLAVIGDRNLMLDNNLGTLEFAVDLRVRGTLPNPSLWGSVNVERGELRLRNRKFDVHPSSVEFLGDATPSAVIDGGATTQVGEYTINATVTGAPEDIRVELSSVPPLPRNDIIALLALGTTSEQLVDTGGITAWEATSFLTGGIQDELEEQMSTVLGFDQFHIDPAYSKTTQTTAPRITIGKAVSDTLYARYGVLVGEQTEQDMTLEYAFSPGVLLIGSWSDKGDQSQGSFGTSIRFRFTFR